MKENNNGIKTITKEIKIKTESGTEHILKESLNPNPSPGEKTPLPPGSNINKK